MKHYTKFLRATTLTLSLTACISQLTITKEHNDAELTKSAASVTSAINALGSAADATSVYNKTQITNILNQLNSVVTALSNSPLNL